MLSGRACKFFTAVLSVGAFALYGARSAEAAFGTDIVGKEAVTSFSAMTEALEFQPVADNHMGTWILTSPDGEAAFWWRKSPEGEREFDAFLCFDAEPFVNAGLDVNKLPDEMKGMLEDRGKIMIGRKLSPKPLAYDGDVTPLSSFEQIVKLDRDIVGYHAALDHYGVTVADGFLFEWAKDISKNDKDIVFVVDPKLLMDAGVDPAKVEGWNFGKVPLEDARGRKFEADKFLKPFALK